MKSNKISIIIINNDSSSLEECIKSISNQTYDNYEILLACNSDNKEKLKKLSNKIKIYDNYFITLVGNKKPIDMTDDEKFLFYMKNNYQKFNKGVSSNEI